MNAVYQVVTREAIFFISLLFTHTNSRIDQMEHDGFMSQQTTQELTAYKKAATAPATAKKPTVALPAAPVNSGVAGLVAVGLVPVAVP